MKKLQLVLIALFTIALFSCDKEDGNKYDLQGTYRFNVLKYNASSDSWILVEDNKDQIMMLKYETSDKAIITIPNFVGLYLEDIDKMSFGYVYDIVEMKATLSNPNKDDEYTTMDKTIRGYNLLYDRHGGYNKDNEGLAFAFEVIEVRKDENGDELNTTNTVWQINGYKK